MGHGSRFPWVARMVRRYTPTGFSPLSPGGYTPYHHHPYEYMNYIIEGEGMLVNAQGEETPLKAGDFALVEPDEKHQYRNKGNGSLTLICGVPKEFE